LSSPDPPNSPQHFQNSSTLQKSRFVRVITGSLLAERHKYGKTLISLSQKKSSNATFYVEYFPLALLPEMRRGVPRLKWSSFLAKRYQLLWMATGVAASDGGVKGSAMKGTRVVGRLHFDRNENLMAVVADEKTFRLFHPGEQKSNISIPLALLKSRLHEYS